MAQYFSMHPEGRLTFSYDDFHHNGFTDGHDELIVSAGGSWIGDERHTGYFCDLRFVLVSVASILVGLEKAVTSKEVGGVWNNHM